MPADTSAGSRCRRMFQSTPPVAEGRCQVDFNGLSGGVLFQSTPPVAEGRCPDLRPARAALREFQSTPPVAEGRCPRLTDWLNGESTFQSTPPVAEGRCLERTPRSPAARLFQSTPPVAEGRCLLDWLEDACRRDVSIHAPRCRGAMPNIHWLVWCFAGGFNPRPPLPRGDASGASCADSAPFCFNPRPPLPRGDAVVIANDGDSGRDVSIHAPRCRGAMP